MQIYTISSIDEGEKLLPYLKKILPNAPLAFFHRMLRKKNIVLNGKKSAGNEVLSKDDEVRLFLSDDTIEKFSAHHINAHSASMTAGLRAYKLHIIYENEHICAVDKPVGLLTQKSKADDFSLNELFIEHLIQTGEYRQGLSVFKPSACNRLDRNTSGLVMMAKTKAGAAFLSALFREKRIKKFYRLIVLGELTDKITVVTKFSKDHVENKTYINPINPDEKLMQTTFTPLFTARLCDSTPYFEQKEGGVRITVTEAQIHTGKPHQIRAQAAKLGYPIVGDIKYTSNQAQRNIYKEYGIKFQLLRAIRLEFPKPGVADSTDSAIDLDILCGLDSLQVPDIFHKI